MTALYAEHFGLREAPFSLAPDPRYLYASEQHREALAHLVYGVRSEGGFVLLTGDVGTGKTTIFRCLLERLPEKTRIAFVLHPRLSVHELLATVCDEYGIGYPEGTASTKTFVDLINAYLLEINGEGMHAVLVIDEAQSLSPEVLEQLRLLTNLETNRHKLLQIILLGQPELREMLARPDMEQLAQRVTARYHLGPLPKGDVGPYIAHRLSVAGTEKRLFGHAQLAMIYRRSGGVPRVINLLCDRALLGAYSRGTGRITSEIMSQAADEVLGQEGRGGQWAWKPVVAAAALVTAAVLLFPAVHREIPPPEVTVTEKDPAPAVEPASPVHDKDERDVPPAPRRDDGPPRDLEWLFGKAAAGSRGESERILLGLWVEPIPEREPGEEFCTAAGRAGLRCLTSSGGLGDLRDLNRPALLRLVNVEGSTFYAALTGLRGEKATLKFREGSGEVRLRWFGEYTLLWRPPPGYTSPLGPGRSGRTVLWVRERLEKIGGRNLKGPARDRYDGVLESAVRAFQAARGIEADGLIGPRTIIELNTAAGEGVPTLSTVEREA